MSPQTRTLIIRISGALGIMLAMASIIIGSAQNEAEERAIEAALISEGIKDPLNFGFAEMDPPRYGVDPVTASVGYPVVTEDVSIFVHCLGDTVYDLPKEIGDEIYATCREAISMVRVPADNAAVLAAADTVADLTLSDDGRLILNAAGTPVCGVLIDMLVPALGQTVRVFEENKARCQAVINRDAAET